MRKKKLIILSLLLYLQILNSAEDSECDCFVCEVEMKGALMLKEAAVWCLQIRNPSTQFSSLQRLTQTIVLTQAGIDTNPIAFNSSGKLRGKFGRLFSFTQSEL